MEPRDPELETLLDAEDRRILSDSNVPDDVKAEVRERRERHRARDVDTEIAEEPPEAP